MGKSFMRLVLAALVSAAGYYATEKFFPDSGNARIGKQKPIAFAKTVSNDVHKKAAQKLLWQPTLEGEKLFTGDSVKTASNAEATLEFERADSSVGTFELEPDSVVSLDNSSGRTTVNFLRGSMFVSVAGPEPINVVVGEKILPLANVEVALSRDVRGNLDVQVLKGPASLAALSSPSPLKLVSPKPNDYVYLSPVTQNYVRFDFQAPPAGYAIELQRGLTRSDLRGVDGTSNASAGQISAQFKVGKFYWRLIARATDGRPVLASAIRRVNVLSKSPPVLLEPADEASVRPDTTTREVEFHWSNPSRLENQVVEIFKAPDYSLAKITRKVSDSTILKEPFPQNGEYSWRVSGTLRGRNEQIVGTMRRFRIIASGPALAKAVEPEPPAEDDAEARELAARLEEEKTPTKDAGAEATAARDSSAKEAAAESAAKEAQAKQAAAALAKNAKPAAQPKAAPAASPAKSVGVASTKALATPDLNLPAENEQVPFKKVSEGAFELKWEAVAGAASYKITIVNRANQESREYNSKSNSLPVRDLKAGSFAWRVRALDGAGIASKPSNARAFTLVQIADMQWADGRVNQQSRYTTKQPTVDLRWTPVKGAANYRLRLWSDREPASDDQWSTTNQPGIMKEVNSDGTYYAQVEALDAKKKVIAQSLKRTIAVAEKALLTAPIFESSMGKEIKAEGSGDVRVAWKPVEGAAEYVLTYRGDATAIEAELRVRGQETTLKKLMPGKYSISLRAVDAHGRIGPVGEMRKMNVPEQAGIAAPTVKGFKVQ